MKEIPLSNGLAATVDDSDFETVSQFKWYLWTCKGSHYARKKRGGAKSLHAFLCGVDGFDVDHIDGNGLNNQRSNLRLATHAQNVWNQRIRRTNTSGFKGVYPKRGKWFAEICHNYKQIGLGSFGSKKDAAEAYDKAALALFGEFAKTNKAMGLL